MSVTLGYGCPHAGCVVGKRGLTGIEIADGRISLVHWFDRRRSEKYFSFNGYVPEQLGSTDFYRIVLRSERLDYTFNRIRLLT